MWKWIIGSITMVNFRLYTWPADGYTHFYITQDLLIITPPKSILFLKLWLNFIYCTFATYYNLNERAVPVSLSMVHIYWNQVCNRFDSKISLITTISNRILYCVFRMGCVASIDEIVVLTLTFYDTNLIIYILMTIVMDILWSEGKRSDPNLLHVNHYTNSKS